MMNWTKNISKIKDGVLILTLIFLAWKGNDFFTQKPKVEIKEKVIFRDVEVPVYETITKNIVREKDTVIFFTKVVHDTISVTDTVIVKPESKIFANTVHLDSFGYVDAKHIITNDELRSVYTPYLTIPERVIEKTNTVIKNKNYLSGSIRYNGNVQLGFDLNNKNVIYGIDYDPIKRNIGVRVGYAFLNY